MRGLTVVFDLDGTLVDTAPDLTGTLNYVLAQIGHGPVAVEDVRPFVAYGGRPMLKNILEREGDDASDARVDELLKIYLAHYGENLANASRPYPGVLDCLEWLKSSGARLAVCTNKYEHLTFSLLDRLRLERYFHAIAGSDTFEVRKPDPGHLTRAIEMAGGRADYAVMVGDTETDIATAKAAGVPVIAVTFGYSDVHVENFEPDALIGHFREFNEQITIIAERLAKA